jgi:hypothetical protein
MRGYEYRMREGVFFLEPDALVAQLTSARGQRLVLPARSSFHIQEDHLGAGDGSRFAPDLTLGHLLREIARVLPPGIEFDGREARIEIRSDRLRGGDIVASRSDLLARGILSKATIGKLDSYKREAFDLNLFGDEAAKGRLLAAANEALDGGGVSLIERRLAIVPQFEAPARQTSWATLAIHRSSASAHLSPTAAGGVRGQEVGEIRTIYPGRVTEPLPAGPWFFRHYGADRPSRGLAILDALAANRPLEKGYQRRAVEAQRRAQDFWWEHGFSTQGGLGAQEGGGEPGGG